MAQYEKKNMVLKVPQGQTAKSTGQMKKLPYTGGSATPAPLSKSTSSAKKAPVGSNTAAAVKKAPVGSNTSRAVNGAATQSATRNAYASVASHQADIARKKAAMATRTTTANKAPTAQKTAAPRLATAKKTPGAASASRSIAAAKKKDFSVR